jgi:hypothetical protein
LLLLLSQGSRCYLTQVQLLQQQLLVLLHGQMQHWQLPVPLLQQLECC